MFNSSSKIAPHPHVVVTRGKMYRDTRIGYLRHLPENTGISFRDYRVIFVPEIEEVSHDKDHGGVPSNGLEKGHYTTFPGQAGGAIGGAQVKI